MVLTWHTVILLIGVILILVSAWPAVNTRLNLLAIGIAVAFGSFLITN